MREVNVASTCPMCHEAGQVVMTNTPMDIPYFGQALETTLACHACNFRHADFMILEQNEPVRLTFTGRGDEALNTRVIRSNSGTIRLAELGFTAEPTPLSESFVSNVEGVLERAEGVLRTAMNWHGEDPQKRALIEGYLENRQLILDGKLPFTLIIDDPLGNSAIVSDAVERRPLTEEEVAQLKIGMVILDAEDLEE